MGSICLIEEDKYVTYSKVLAKYFLAEGVCSQHTVFLASLDDDSDKFLSKLPRPLNADEVSVDDQRHHQQQQQQFGIVNDFGGNRSSRTEMCRTSSPDTEKQLQRQQEQQQEQQKQEGNNELTLPEAEVIGDAAASPVPATPAEAEVPVTPPAQDCAAPSEVPGASQPTGASDATTQGVPVPPPMPAPAPKAVPPPVKNEVENEVDSETNVIRNENRKENELRIAWRYNQMLPLVHSEQVNAKIGHHFNLMENIDEITLSTAYTYIWPRDYHRTLNGVMTLENGDDQNINNLSDTTNETSPTIANNHSNNTNNTTNSSPSPITTVPSEEDDGPQDAKTVFLKRCLIHPRSKTLRPFNNPQYVDLLQDVAKMLKGDEFHIHTPTNPLKSICRICITSLGSAFWYQEDDYDLDLLKFMVALRALIRSSLAVAFVTMPMHLIRKYVSPINAPTWKYHEYVLRSVPALLTLLCCRMRV